VAAGEDILGTAVIELRAKFEDLAKDLDKARSDAEAALKGIEGTAQLGVDTTDVEAGAAAADSELDGVEGTAELGLDAADVEGGAAAADAMLDGVEGTAQLGLDWSEFDGAVSSAQSQLDSIEGTATLGVDTSAVDGAVGEAQSQLDGMNAGGPGQEFGAGFGGGGAVAAGGIANVSGGLKGVAGLAAGFVGIQTFSGFIGDAREAREVTSLLGSQLQTTGADAWTSVDSINALAGSIQATTGISDEAVSSSAAWLTSFKNVRNESGELNNVFDRAIVVASDLSAIMGTDMQGATTQLGKALNDPIKGMSALGRAGVTFTDEQKAMVEQLVATGDLLGAQKIILGEVEGQVGGSAAAMADSTDLLGAKASDLSESFGTALVPALDAFAAVAIPVMDFFLGMPGPMQAVVVIVAGLALGALALAVALGPLVLGMGLAGPAGAVAGGGFAAAAGGLWALMAPMLPIIAVIALVVGAVYLLVTHWDTLKNAAAAAWDFITNAVGTAVEWLVALFTNFTPVGLLLKHWDTIKAGAGAAWDWIADKVGGVVDWFTSIPGRIGDAFGGMWDGVIGGAKAAFNFMASAWNQGPGAIAFTVPAWIPVIGGKRFDMPDMPMLAEGGQITGSGFAIVGERGPEVRWLNKGEAISPIGGSSGGGGAGGAGLVVNNYAPIGGVGDFARELKRVWDDRGYGGGA
jgi:outer membrane murein-binding lipoprotein Lpp